MDEQRIQETLNDPEFWQWMAQQTNMSEEQCQQQIGQMIQSGQQEAIQQVIQIVAAYLQAKGQASQETPEQGFAQMARMGAKLAYIDSLRGNCPIGYETQYYKRGGRVCKKCVKKATGGSLKGEATHNFGDAAVEQFKREFDIRNTARK